MTVRYRTNNPPNWSGLGSNLSPAQVDENFFTLDQRVQTLEDLPPAAAGIDHFTIVGDQLTVVMTDLTTLGPYTLPVVPLVFRGTWQPDTPYTSGEMFSYGDTIYQVTWTHTSESTTDGFDPGANDGLGHDYYGFGLTLNGGVPSGGTTGQWLRKASSVDFETAWANAPIPAGGTTGQFLRKLNNVDYNSYWGGYNIHEALDVQVGDATHGSILRYRGTQYNKEMDYPPRTQTTDDLFLDVNDLFCFNLMTNVSGCTITVPLEADWTADSLFAGSMLHFRQCTAGGLTFVEDATDVDIQGVDGFLNATDTQGAVVTLYYAGNDVWYLYGMLAPEP